MAQRAAVFLDRDGVLNEAVYNSKASQYEAPHQVGDLKVYPEVVPALRDLQKTFKLFVVSNQPDFALGKATLEQINEIAKKFASEMASAQIDITEFYYCHHHPNGVVAEYTYVCDCRKPKPYFLEKAATDHQIDLKASWMVGDRDTDIQCGQSVGCKTVLIENPHSKANQGKSKPTFRARDIAAAADIILKTKGVK